MLEFPSPPSDSSTEGKSNPARTKQVQGDFDGEASDPTKVTAAAVVVVTLMRGAVDIDQCNGLHYARGLVATNEHCFKQSYDALYVDFGTLARMRAKDGKAPSPDYFGEYRCRATRHPFRAAHGTDVAVVKLNAVPAAFASATVAFDPAGGSGATRHGADALLVNYWMDPDLEVENRGKVTQAFRLKKYDLKPPHCVVDWEETPELANPCLSQRQIRHYCDTTQGSSGAPLYGLASLANAEAGGSTASLLAIALHVSGVADRFNCAVPAAAFAGDMPKQ